MPTLRYQVQKSKQLNKSEENTFIHSKEKNSAKSQCVKLTAIKRDDE